MSDTIATGPSRSGCACSTPSGRFVLRINPGLHAALRAAASDLGISLNDYCSRKLTVPHGDSVATEGAVEAVRRAVALFGASLLGVAAFGSWARDELADSSDIDILVVLSGDIPLTRALYRCWDEAPIAWCGHRVEPHFVHLPDAGEVRGGLWAEVAIDGVVLFERSLRLSTGLARVRHDIAAGRLRRRVVHGQGYWAEVA